MPAARGGCIVLERWVRAGAQHDALDGVGRREVGRGVGDVPLEARAGEELVDVRLDEPVAQQRLGRHDDERLAELAPHLPAQQVEVVGGRRHVADLPVGRLDARLLAEQLAGEDVLVVVAHLQHAPGRRKGV